MSLAQRYILTGIERQSAERPRGSPVHHELQVDRVIRKVKEVFRIKLRRKVARNHARVFCTETKRNERPDVREHGVPHVRFELVEMLVREGEADPILPKLGDHVRDRRRSEILKLVEIEEEVFALSFRKLCATEGR